MARFEDGSPTEQSAQVVALPTEPPLQTQTEDFETSASVVSITRRSRERQIEQALVQLGGIVCRDITSERSLHPLIADLRLRSNLRFRDLGDSTDNESNSPHGWL